MFASASTQQPAAICALKAPNDAIHVLEAVRVGLVPRVTRRLTGHERSLIRAGTVWVWEEEETNMRRWTDGRRWGASRVGGGGFLVYTESSESVSPPPSTTRPDLIRRRSEQLVKQTYSTSMTEALTGKVKKFHVVAYAHKRFPQGDVHNPLPLPHQLPLLVNLKVPAGIWPEWEPRREVDGTTPRKVIHVEALIAPIHNIHAQVGNRPITPSYTSYDAQMSASYAPPPPGRPRTPVAPQETPSSSGSMDRFHPYQRGRPPPFPGIGEYPPRRSSLPAPGPPSAGYGYPSYEHMASQVGLRDRASYPDHPVSAPPNDPSTASAIPLPSPPHPHQHPHPPAHPHPHPYGERYDPYRSAPMRSPSFYTRGPPTIGSDNGMPMYGAYRHPSDSVVQQGPLTPPVARSPRYMIPSPTPVVPEYGQAPVTLPPLRLALDEGQLPLKVAPTSTSTSPASHALPFPSYAQQYPPGPPPRPQERPDQYGYGAPMTGTGDVGGGARYPRQA